MASSSIKYRGEVTIQLEKDGKIIKTVKGNNEGCSLLFGFIAEVLTGNYASAEGYRPMYIQLFHGGIKGQSADSYDISTLKSEDRRTLSTIMYSTSNFTNYKKSDSDNPYNGDVGEAAFKFVIPFIQIDTDREDDEKDINLFALYGTRNKAIYNSPLAYYKLVDGVNWGSLLSTADTDAEYNVVIVWKLIIENK